MWKTKKKERLARDKTEDRADNRANRGFFDDSRSVGLYGDGRQVIRH